MVSFSSNYGDGANDAIATVGFATKVSNVYVGAFYGGHFWTGAPPNNYTKKQFTEATVPAGGEIGKTYNAYNNISVAPDPVNNAALIVGVADMGFRLTYRTNYQSFKESNIVTGNQVYKSYEAEEGYIAPQIAWAMAKDLTKDGIRPYVTLDLVFNRNYKKVKTAGADADNNSGERIVYSENHFDPSLSIGAGGYTFFNNNGFKLSADFDYVLTLNIYDNEYSYVEDGHYKTGKIEGTFRQADFPFEEKSYVSNLLTPSLSGSWGIDKLSLKFKLNLPFTIINGESATMSLDDTNKMIHAGANEVSTAFTFRPDLRLALQYKIIPDRLALNTGARIQATAISLKTINRKEYDPEGNLNDSSKMIDNSYGSRGSFVSRFHIGFTFNFTENVWAEAMTGVSNMWGDSAIDVFAPGGLFSFGGILVSLKF
jgi:hypothetical protein